MIKSFISFYLLCSFTYALEISFDEALKNTLNNNHELKVKKLEIEKTKQDLLNIKGQELGFITFQENITKTNNPLHAFGMKLGSHEAKMSDFGFTSQAFSGINTMIASDQEIGDIEPNSLNNPSSRTNFETKLVYQLPLFTGFKLESAKDMTRLQINAQEKILNNDTNKLSLEVLKAYNGAVAAKYFISAIKQAKKASGSFIEFANEMYNEGYATTIEIDQAKVYDMQVNSMLLEAKNQYSLAIAYLQFLTNNKDIKDVKDFYTTNKPTHNLMQLQEIALQNREDFQAMKLHLETMQKKVKYEKSSIYPTLGAHMEYGYNDNHFNNLSDEKDYYLLALGFEYKIFDGLTSTTAIQKAKIDYNKMNHYYQMMEDGIKLEVQKAYLNLTTKTSILNEKTKAETLAKNLFEKSKQMYENQLIKMNDLLIEQAKKDQAIAQTIKAKYEKTIATASLYLAIGSKIQKDKK
jgi:outer membrane protein TolC